jgi:hypothetical protein
MPVLSPVKNESVGLGGSRMGTKKTRLQKWEDHVHGSATKKLKHTAIQNYLSRQSKLGRQESISRALRWTGLVYRNCFTYIGFHHSIIKGLTVAIEIMTKYSIQLKYRITSNIKCTRI